MTANTTEQLAELVAAVEQLLDSHRAWPRVLASLSLAKEALAQYETERAAGEGRGGAQLDAARYVAIRNSEEFQVCRWMGGEWRVCTGTVLDGLADAEVLDAEQVTVSAHAEGLFVPYSKAIACLQTAYEEGTRGVGYNSAANQLYDGATEIHASPTPPAVAPAVVGEPKPTVLWDGKTWMEGTAGGCNVITYNGEDVRGVAYIPNEEHRKRVIELFNSAPANAKAGDSGANVHKSLNLWRRENWPLSNCTFPDCTCSRNRMCESAIPTALAHPVAAQEGGS